MPRILLINPNTSESTTSRMVAIAQAAAPAGTTVIGATARAGVAMITDEASLRASVSEVIALGVAAAGDVDGMIVAAFGDPGLADLRGRVTVPVVGIAESAMHAAAAGGRRFGIATVTPGLAGAITARATALGLQACFTGLRLTEGDPLALVAEPAQLLAALAAAV